MADRGRGESSREQVTQGKEANFALHNRGAGTDGEILQEYVHIERLILLDFASCYLIKKILCIGSQTFL